MKKALVFLALLVFSLAVVSAVKMEIIPLKENFEAGENVTLKVSLLGEDNSVINDNLKIILEDPKGIAQIEKNIESNKFVDIPMSENAAAGFWKVIVQYNQQESTGFFNIKEKETAKFELNGDKLTITNTGNTEYHKSVQIIIGNTIGSKQTDLRRGEKITYRLIAPEGIYNIRITDGETTLTQANVALTGKVVGIIDERASSGVSLTGGIGPEENNDLSLDLLKKGKTVYVFIAVIFGAMIFLLVERRFKRKAYG